MSENNNGTSGLGWFLAGLGLGAIAGVLYAPKAGRETRDDLLNGALPRNVLQLWHSRV
jgi:gas vesicle protein